MKLKLIKPDWRDIEYFDKTWKDRIKKMTAYLPGDVKSVVDLGAGKEWLREFLPKDVMYYPVDLKKISNQTIECDFNKKQFPDISCDCI
ncbi:MAG: hypothetical protein R3250_09890, partial [Melioribacteraceae bacterium]|nr:hypothetical protein [Melioribacteraceae bacterium]